jgi:hypothetical protein
MTKQKGRSHSKDLFEDFRQDWIGYKKEAIKNNDYSLYKIFLEEVYKTFIKLYADIESPESISLVDTVLKVATCELQVINIKCNKS